MTLNSYHRIWLHAIFSTKNRQPLLYQTIEQPVYNFLINQMQELGCPTRIINGMPDHLHILFLMNPNKTVTEVLKQIKGASSHWINQNQLTKERFSWQKGYGVFSVSESQVEKVFQYIYQQKNTTKRIILVKSIHIF